MSEKVKPTRRGELMLGVPDPAACVRDIAEWFRVHTPPAWDRFREAVPASAEVLVVLESELGLELPAAFRIYLTCSGGGLAFWEYSGLNIKKIVREYRRQQQYLAEGVYAGHEIFPDDRGFLRRTKWHHPGWLPFAEDGCGNMFCLDLAPGDSGLSGQVFSWDIRGGPGISTPHPRSFGQFLARYREILLSGRFVYEIDSGTFDGGLTRPDDDARP